MDTGVEQYAGQKEKSGKYRAALEHDLTDIQTESLKQVERRFFRHHRRQQQWGKPPTAKGQQQPYGKNERSRETGQKFLITEHAGYPCGKHGIRHQQKEGSYPCFHKYTYGNAYQRSVETIQTVFYIFFWISGKECRQRTDNITLQGKKRL